MSGDATVGRPARQPVSIGCPADLAADWRVEWEERAAIRQYDGGQPREDAEIDALDEITGRMAMAGVL